VLSKGEIAVFRLAKSIGDEFVSRRAAAPKARRHGASRRTVRELALVTES